MIALWLPLWSLIGPDEGFIFLIIVFAFFITISIIVKLRSNSDMSCTIGARNLVAQECMALTQNPFQFRLSVLKDENCEDANSKADEVDTDESNKDEINEAKSEDESEKTNEEPKPSTSQVDEEVDLFKKGVKIDVFCKIDFYLCYFWGVNIDQFHNFMRLNSQSFNDRLLDGSLFEQNFLEKSEPKLINGSDQVKTIKLTCSNKVTPETLGQSPRTCYPLIVILARDLSKEEERNKNEDDVLFMINVVHVKDRVCPLETNVITRLLKKRSGLTINLQTLYTPNDDVDESTGTNSAICVICQENLVSIALLPCKHTCTCLECFTKIDKCPLCRSYIRSYFMLKPITDTNNQEQAPQNTENNQSNQTTQTSPDSNQQQSNQNRGFFKKIGSKFSNLFR